MNFVVAVLFWIGLFKVVDFFLDIYAISTRVSVSIPVRITIKVIVAVLFLHCINIQNL